MVRLRKEEGEIPVADLEKIGENIENAGKQMQGCGCLLTLAITIPLILSFWLGPVGVAIGAVVAILAIASYLGKGKVRKQ